MSVEDTLKERGNRYGDFSDHARICQALKRTMENFELPASPGNVPFKPYENLPAIHKQALEVIADKIARILSGDPNYADNWHDIQGYAKLVEDRLPKEDTRKPELSKFHEAPYAITCWLCNHGPEPKSYDLPSTAAANCAYCAKMITNSKLSLTPKKIWCETHHISYDFQCPECVREGI